MPEKGAFMRQAIALARRGLGRTAPNPPVGAVVVRDGQVIGTGFHPRAGQPHAEIFALQEAGSGARGATLYVTLEPCAHHGRTPPCTEAIIAAGLARVVVGSQDPNPLVAGRGLERLKAAGIAVELGVDRQETDEIIAWFAKWIATGRPYVILKAALTLDGRIAASSGDAKWITSEASRAYVHELRDQVDALLVGIGTVLADDPQLNCRREGGRDPLRVVLDRDLKIPSGARCLGVGCLVLTARDPDSRPELADTGAEVLRLGLDARGRFAWEDILDALGDRGLHALMVEGGSAVFGGLLRSHLVDRLLCFIAPRILGGGRPLVDWGATERIADAYPLVVSGLRTIGTDVLIEAYPEERYVYRNRGVSG